MPKRRNSREILAIKAPFDLQMRLPCSKSIALRQLAISALANHPTALHGLDESDDASSMVACLKRLGVSVNWDGQDCTIDPREFNHVDPIELDVGMSGLTLRLLISIAALRSGPTRFVGHPSLERRPNKDLLDALQRMNCRVESNGGFLPILIEGPLQSGCIELSGSVSSQYLSSLLLAAPRLEEGLEIDLIGDQISASYIDVTLRELAKRGVQVERTCIGYRVQPDEYSGDAISIEGDASAATYFSALATLHSSRITFSNLGSSSCQGDRKFLDLCADMGARVSWSDESTEVEGPTELVPINDTNMVDMPDAALTMMAVAPYLNEATTIAGLASLPFKECDRIACPAKELRRAGVTVDEGTDHIVVQPALPKSAAFETYDDHRMAMSFAVLATKTPGCRIVDPRCVGKTYPNYWRDLDRLYTRT